jgi:hypothetical protein
MRSRRLLLAATAALILAAGSLVGAGPAAATDYRVSLSVDRTDVVSGKRVNFTVQVSPSSAGARVLLQERRGGSWKTVRKATLSAASAATMTVRPEGRGTRKYRAVRPATAGSKRVTTRSITITVRAWSRFDRLAPTSGTVQRRTVGIDGKAYENSLVLAQCSPAEWTWDLSRRFDTFRSVVGVVDAGADGIVKTVKVYVDGSLRWQQNPKKGSPQVAKVPVSGAATLKIRVEGACGANGRTVLALGRPRLLG